MKRIALKKVMAVILAAGMTMSMLSGCGSTGKTETSGQGQEASSGAQQASTVQESDAAAEEGFQHDPNLNEVGVEPIAKEKVTLTVGVAQNANIQDYETNTLTTMIEEAGNVNLEFIEYPSDEYAQKLRLQMSAGGEELPDIIIYSGMADALIAELAEAEMIIPLDEYYDNCSVYYSEGFERVLENSGIDLRKKLTNSDGHIYVTCRYNETITSPPYARMWVYTPWLEELDIEAPATTEEFYDMLYAFKNQDPNGNGIADEIPLLGSASSNGSYYIDYIMGAFVERNSRRNYLFAEDGQLKLSYTQDKYKEGVLYMKSLVDEGLLEPVSFTQTKESFGAIVNAEGDHLVGAFGYLSPSFVVDAEEKNNWTLLGPLTGPDGTCVISYLTEEPVNNAVITSNCENAELAFRVLDLFAREDMTITSRWGKEGENWVYVEDAKSDPQFSDVDFTKTFAGYPAYIYEYNSCFNQAQNNQWNNLSPSFRTAEVVGGWYAASIEAGSYNEQLAMKLAEYEAVKSDEVVSKFKFSDDVMEEATELANTLDSYVKEKLALWCTGAADIEKEWDSYLEELESMGASRFLELAQEAYDSTK